MSVTPAVHCRIKKSNKRYLTFSLEKIRRGTRDFSHECFYSFRAFLFMPRRTITNIIISPISSPNTRAFAFKAARNIIILSHNVSQDVADGYFDINTLLVHRIDVLARCISSSLWVSNGIRKDTNVYLMLFPHNITIEVRGGEVARLNPDERTTALFLQRSLLVGDARGTSSNDTLTEERCRLELSRLSQRDLKKPETYNPNKPGALSKSEKRDLRQPRKAREAMIRRIHKWQEGNNDAPKGFIFHRHDSIEARLRSIGKNETNENAIIMLDEFGEPCDTVLKALNNDGNTGNKTPFPITLILADQMGYAACDEKTLAQSEFSITKVSLGPLSILTSQCITIAHHYLDTYKVT
mmetsp:Transcript_6369/g.7292  ORF Transcript_6369/g.7292 Transcript_6369/m.7292 type:complete len:353 (+) Transcript_6369:155-1213(+)